MVFAVFSESPCIAINTLCKLQLCNSVDTVTSVVVVLCTAGPPDTVALRCTQWTWPGSRSAAGERRFSNGKDKEWPDAITHGSTGRSRGVRTCLALSQGSNRGCDHGEKFWISLLFHLCCNCRHHQLVLTSLLSLGCF